MVRKETMFKLPQLPYQYNALEPVIDARTMEIHHKKHHQGYTDNLNKQLDGHRLASASIQEILAQVSTLNPAIRNNGGGFYNHLLFWENLQPPELLVDTSDIEHAPDMDEKLKLALEENFGSFIEFKQQFSQMATTLFGSGWTWLIKRADGKLVIANTSNQDNPLMDISEFKGQPLLTIDLWEHAYYLKYQNRRDDYVQAFWQIVNWSQVAQRFSQS